MFDRIAMGCLSLYVRFLLGFSSSPKWTLLESPIKKTLHKYENSPLLSNACISLETTYTLYPGQGAILSCTTLELMCGAHGRICTLVQFLFFFCLGDIM